MKISSSLYRNDRNESCQSFKGIPTNPKYIPEGLGKIGKVVGKYVSSPEQKLLLATTALIFQPAIDLKFAQEEKQIDTAIKSTSKAIAGGLTGVLIRAAFIKFTTSKIGFKQINKFNNYFLPKNAFKMKQTDPEAARLLLKKYSKALGTLFSIIFMVGFSNSAVDVPLTSDLQDLLGGVIKEKKTWKQSLTDVAMNRSNKIKEFVNKQKQKLLKINKKVSKAFEAINANENTQTEINKT